MGNFHCIPSSCAEVVWREYLPPVVRWRYPGEEWQEMVADNYTLEEECPDKNYIIEFYFDYYSNDILIYQNRFYRVSGSFKGKNFNVYGYDYDGTYFTHVAVEYFDYDDNQNIIKRYLINSSPSAQYVVTSYQVIDGNPNISCICNFSVLKDGEVVYAETRDICPEVEKLDCRLSDVSKSIKIEKEAYLQRIEIRNQSIDVVVLPNSTFPFIFTTPLPQECLNIYNTYTLAAPFPNENIPAPGFLNPYQFIQQICSPPGCPPPEYKVICECDCEDCPDGTCALECGDHICCYDTSGIAIKQIPIDEYCGGQN